MDAELCSQENLVSFSGASKPFAQEFFVVTIGTFIRCQTKFKFKFKADSLGGGWYGMRGLLGAIPECCTQFKCMVEDLEPFFVAWG